MAKSKRRLEKLEQVVDATEASRIRKGELVRIEIPWPDDVPIMFYATKQLIDYYNSPEVAKILDSYAKETP